MTAEITELLHVFESARYNNVTRPLLDRDERHDLVLRTFHEQLHLAVLVGGSKCCDRSLSDECTIGSLLAETLCPELNEPVGNVAEPIRVRHQDIDGFSITCLCKPLKSCLSTCRVLGELIAVAPFDHGGSAFEKSRYVDADKSGR